MTAAPLDNDEAGMTRLAAWILFAFTRPTDRALTGWCPAGEAAFEVEELTAAMRTEAMR